MTTTLSIDKEIRDKAYARAKKDKLSLSAVARMLLLDYAEWRIMIWTRTNRLYDNCEIEYIEEIDTSDWWDDFNKKSFEITKKMSNLLKSKKW